MPTRYWIIAIALGLTFTTTQLSAQSANEAVENQANGDRQDGSRKQQASPLGIPVRILEQPEQAEDAKRQREEAGQREKENLIAQKSMANSTEEIVLLSNSDPSGCCRSQSSIGHYQNGASVDDAW